MKGGVDPGVGQQPRPVILSLGHFRLNLTSRTFQLSYLLLTSSCFTFVSPHLLQGNKSRTFFLQAVHFLLFPTCHNPAIFVRSACFESYPFESNPFSASRMTSLKSKCEPMPLVLWWLYSPQAQAQMALSGFQGLGWSGLVFSPVFSPHDPAESNLKWFVMLRRHLQLSAHATSYPFTLNLHSSGFRALLASDLFWVYPQCTLSVSLNAEGRFWQRTWSTVVLKKCFMNDQYCWCITTWPRNSRL